MDRNILKRLKWLEEFELRKLVVFALIIAVCFIGCYLLIKMYMYNTSLSASLIDLLLQIIPNAIVALVIVAIVYQLDLWGFTSEKRIRALIQHSAGIDKIREGLLKIRRTLTRNKFKPDLIISFTRSASILAGMLATDNKLAVQHILTIPRNVNRQSAQKYIVGEPIESFNPEYFKGKKILIVFFLIDTIRGLQTGLEFLKQKGINLEKKDYMVCSLFITSRAVNNPESKDFIYAYEDARELLEEMPWVVDKYDYL